MQERPGTADTPSGVGWHIYKVTRDGGSTSLVMQGQEGCWWQQGPWASIPVDPVVLTFPACDKGSG